ncbi:MAG TPA: SDR family oxidoreductase [Pseudolysinimonas sp.]|jgi:NAD(P)-dependent dehydrogenase (short-subunit alcohol dehydrogenase family)
MDLHLTGKRAIISGGGKGIGLAVAKALTAEGVDVAISGRSAGITEVAAQLAAESGRRVIGLQADTGDDDSVRAMVAQAVAELGGVDILVNTAATAWTADMNKTGLETTDDLVRSHFEIKVLGYLRTARAAAPHMVEQGWGRIINVSGLGARWAGSVTQTIRNVGVSALTKNLADELGPHGINVTVVHPAATRTEATSAAFAERAEAAGTTVAEQEQKAATNSIHRLIDASEVADVVAFLASPRSVAITGDAIAVGGGVPGPIYY